MLKTCWPVFTCEPCAAASAQFLSSTWLWTPAPEPHSHSTRSFSPGQDSRGLAPWAVPSPGVNRGPASHTPVPGVAAGPTGVRSEAGSLPPGNSRLFLPPAHLIPVFPGCSCEYYVNDAPRVVLDKLESLGYRVVSMTGVGQTLVWCLHRE